MRITKKLVLVLAFGSVACGGASEPPASAPTAAAVPAAPPPPQSELRAEHLPPALGFLRFGETTPAEVKAQFTADNLFISDHIEARGLMPVRTLGPNAGRQAGMVAVGRKTNVAGYIGQLGEDYGNINFYFTPLADGQPPVLYKVEVTQLNATGSVCRPGAALAVGEGLTGCDPNDRIPPSAPTPEGAYHACVNHTEGRVMSVRCTVSGENRSVSYELAVGQVQ